MESIRPPDAQQIPRFAGIRTFMRMKHTRDLADVDFVVAGVPSDLGSTGRVGQRYAPESIRSYSSYLRPYSMYHKIDVFEHVRGADYGDLDILPGYLIETYRAIESSLLPIVQAGVIPILLGGDHSVTLPELRAVARRHGPLSLIQFDSHSDAWDEYWGQKYTSGTLARRAVEENIVDPYHSVQIGLRGTLYSAKDVTLSQDLGYRVFAADEIRSIGIPKMTDQVRATVGGRPTFLSFDIDFVDAVHAPATVMPEFDGFTSGESFQMLRGLVGVNFVAFDVVEVIPAYDPTGITAWLAANIAYEFICHVALAKKRERMGK